MRVKVVCAGALGERCENLELEATSPIEVISLMEANYPGFRRQIIAGHYAMVMHNGDDQDPHAKSVSTAEDGISPLADSHILFLPIPRGETTATVWLASQIMTYTGISSAVLATTIATVVVAVGVTLALMAVADLMAPKIDEADQGDGITGFSFSGPVNTIRQGNPVPVCYGGPIRVGSQVVSVSLASRDIPV